nr:hypothetical protein [Sicyoidochytrium minutum DNA virus]
MWSIFLIYRVNSDSNSTSTSRDVELVR